MSLWQFIAFRLVQTGLYFLDRLLILWFRWSVLDGLEHNDSFWTDPFSWSDRQECAKVSTVVWRSRLVEMTSPKEDNFILRFVKWADPKTILHSGFSLMDIDEHFAYFAYCDDVDPHVGAFFFDEQFRNCKQIVKIPVVRLVSEVKDWERAGILTHQNVKVAILYNTGRCGSTLLTRIFANPGLNTSSINEPTAISRIASNPKMFTIDSGVSREEVLSTCLKLLIHSSTLGRTNQGLVVIKLQPFAIRIAREIIDAIPDVVSFYLIREPMGWIVSFQAVLDKLFFKSLLSWLKKLVPDRPGMRDYLFMQQFWDQNSERAKMLMLAVDTYRFEDDLDIISLGMYAGNVLSMQETIEARSKHRISVMTYHDLLQEPRRTLQIIFEACNHPVVLEENYTLPQDDSQANSSLSRNNLRQFRKKSLSPEQLNKINEFFSMCNLPPCEKFPKNGKEMREFMGIL